MTARFFFACRFLSNHIKVVPGQANIDLNKKMSSYPYRINNKNVIEVLK